MAASPSIPFHIWVAALSAGYIPLEAVVTWADGRIMVDPYQAPWILDLSLSKTSQDAEGVLRLEWSRQSESSANGTSPLHEPGNLHLGFLFLCFVEGRLTMAELLQRAGRYADGQGYFCVTVDSGAFFCLLNEIDEGESTRPGSRPLSARIEELFAPFADAARAALCQLPSRHV